MSTQQPTATGGSDAATDYSGSLNGSDIAMAQLRANAEKKRELRANATSLSDPEWERLDDTVFPVIRDNLVLMDRVEQEGLTVDVSMSQTESTWAVSDDLTEAEYTMDARTRSEEDIHSFARQGVPLPFIHKDYRIGERELQKSRRQGEGLDTMMARSAARKVAEGIEDLLLWGAPNIAVQSDAGLMKLPGLLNYPDRFEYVGGTWDTPSNVKNDLNNAIELLENNAIYAGGNGYWLLYGTSVQADFRNDYNTDASLTVRDRVEDFSEIDDLIHVPRMPDNQAVLLKPIPEFFDVARDPQQVQNIEWESHGGFENQYKVISLVAPRIKSSMNGRTGIVHLTGI